MPEPTSPPPPDLERLCIDTVRVLAMDAVQEADSGHPGTPMALAPLGYVLWTRHLRHDPRNPGWPDRDRFVLSAGHASMLLYALLYLTGYDLSLDDLRDFRQWESQTPGHPEFHHTPGVETTTGPLGQGVANSVGMALAERWLAHHFNRPGFPVVDHYTYAVCSDGDLMEGISHEAAAFAGHQKLGKLIWLFDDNRITIDGSTDLAGSTDQGRRFEAYGWHVQRVTDVNDLDALDRAIEAARREKGRPSLVIVNSTIAFGSPNKAGHASTHGSPLGHDEIRATKENLGYPSLEPFFVDEAALAEWRRLGARGGALNEEWRRTFEGYEREYPALAHQLRAYLAGELPDDWDAEVPDFTALSKPEATRASSGRVIQGLAARVGNLVGGSADLSGSNKTTISASESIQANAPGARNIHFGIREHGMGGILNGMALHGGVRPFGGTFLIFSDYMRPSIRLAALMGLPVRYVFSHDSIGLGEDGPTHQPIEQLAALRAIPGLLDLRPADGPETAEAWKVALERKDGPAFLALTRQSVPLRDMSEMSGPEGLRRGAYTLVEASTGSPEVLLIGTGSEVHVAVAAREVLERDGIPTRVVSMPSWYLFGRQDAAYREEVLPSAVPARVSIEAGVTLGWERWVGPDGVRLGIDGFGASAPYATLYEKYGLTARAVADAAVRVLKTGAGDLAARGQAG